MDGANGKQLATINKQQAQLTVVIVRQAMIEAPIPTRSFTQARALSAQVLRN
jgi:hypothetical protein